MNPLHGFRLMELYALIPHLPAIKAWNWSFFKLFPHPNCFYLRSTLGRPQADPSRAWGFAWDCFWAIAWISSWRYSGSHAMFPNLLYQPWWRSFGRRTTSALPRRYYRHDETVAHRQCWRKLGTNFLWAHETWIGSHRSQCHLNSFISLSVCYLDSFSCWKPWLGEVDFWNLL